MITLERPAYYDSKRYNEYCGLSTDEKTTISAYNGDEFYEINTGKYYKYNQVSNEWVEQPTSGGGGGGSVPKPLTFDYMPEGYPTKSVGTVTLMEEQQLAFTLSNGVYMALITNAFKIVEGQTYTVNWDGTEYECVGVVFNSILALGNLSMMGAGDDTGEPFIYAYDIAHAYGMFSTLDTAASHTISVKTTAETVTPMAEEYLPTIPADKLPTIPADKLPTIPADKLPTIPADKLPTIPVIEFTTNISANIANSTQPFFTVSNLSYSEIYALVEKGNFQIKDSSGTNYRPIRTEIESSGSIFVDILVIGTPTTYANLACDADQHRFYRNNWWQIEATRK